jgi:hypothetical protein
VETATAPPPTSRNTSGHRGDSDPAENIAALRNAIRGGVLDDGCTHTGGQVERERDAALAEACMLRARLRDAWAQRDEAQRACVAAQREARGLARAMDGMQAHVDGVNAAWRAASERSAADAQLIASLRAQLDDLLAPAVPARGRRGKRSPNPDPTRPLIPAAQPARTARTTDQKENPWPA